MTGRAGIGIGLLVAAIAAAGLFAGRVSGKEPGRAGGGKEYSRTEIATLLARTPKGYMSCPVGEPWPKFAEEAPHSPKTVAVLRSMYQEEKDPWKRYYLAGVLARQEDPALRPLWEELLRQPKQDRHWRWTALAGLGRTGTDEEFMTYVRRLGKDPEMDQGILWVLLEQRMPAAVPLVRRYFENPKNPRGQRQVALTVLLNQSEDRRPTLRRAIADRDPEIRLNGARLVAQYPETRSDPSLSRQAEKIKDAAIRSR